MRTSCSNSRGQAVVEYAVLLGVVIAAIVGMQVYAKRGLQAEIKMAADGLSPFGDQDRDGKKAQREGMRYEAGERRNRAVEAPGKIQARESAVTTDVQRKTTLTETAGGGRQTQIVTDTVNTSGALTGRGAGASSYSEVVVQTRDSSGGGTN